MMSVEKDQGPISAAASIRENAIDAARRQAEHVLGQLQRDVLRLLDNAHGDIIVPPAPAPPIPPEPPLERSGDDEARVRRYIDTELRRAIVDIVRAEIGAIDGAARERRHLDSEFRQAIVDIVRAEIAALDVAALVKAEIETQLRTITRLLQERLKANGNPNAQKLSSILSRRRR